MTSGQHLPWRRLIGPGLATLCAFCALMALGLWQLQRLTWKEGIIAEIARADAAPPVPVPASPGPYEKVVVSGTWIPGKAALYGDEVRDTPNGPVPGAELLLPLRRPDGSVWLVDLGWVAQTSPQPVAAPPNPVGYVHAAMPAAWFSPPDDPAHGLYYTLDPQRIAAGMGLGKVAPYILMANAPLPAPSNNHYEYALTWFSLAGVLVFQFIFFARKRLLFP
jgi:surfeit locus 1 family protein